MATGFHSKTLAQLIIKKECYFQLIVSHLFCEGIILAWKQFPLKTIWLERNFIFSCSYRISELCELVFMKTIPAFDCKGMLFSVDCVSLAWGFLLHQNVWKVKIIHTMKTIPGENHLIGKECYFQLIVSHLQAWLQ